MKLARTTIALMIPVLFSTMTESTFSERRSQELLNAARDTNPGNVGFNDKVIEKAVVAMKQTANDRLHVCFAIDGNLPPSEFALQKGTVLNVTAVLGGLENTKFAAVQYGAIVNVISALTDELLTADGFLRKVGDSVPASSPQTFIAPGIQYCISQFALDSGSTNIIVLLGEGKSTFGDDASSPFGAVSVAKKFLEGDSNRIVAGLFGGDAAGRNLLNEITGDESKVVSVSSSDRIGDLLAVIIHSI